MKPTTLPEALAEICAMDASLSARLAAYARAMRELKSPFADEYDRLVARLRLGGVGAAAPDVGEFMPSFLLPDAAGRLVGLEQLLARGPAVVSFNRGHWCPFCKIELAALADAHSDFAELDAEVVSIMPERQQFTSAVEARLSGRIRILTDIDNGYALLLGLTMWVGEPIRGLMAERDLRLDAYQGNDAWFLPLPATFVIGRDGRVKARFVDPNFRNRMEIPDILRALRSP
jgi:peroxiredoxin